MSVSADSMKKLKEENNNVLINEAFFDSQFKNYQILIKAKH